MNEQDYTHEGVFNFVDNEIDQSTGTLMARGTFKNSDMFLAPGMFGMAKLTIDKLEPQLLIPDEAVGSDQSLKFVYVLDDSNKVVRKLVETGFLYDNNLRVITSGLAENDQVIIKGLQKAFPGQPVTPEKSKITFAAREQQP